MTLAPKKTAAKTAASTIRRMVIPLTTPMTRRLLLFLVDPDSYNVFSSLNIYQNGVKRRPPSRTYNKTIMRSFLVEVSMPSFINFSPITFNKTAYWSTPSSPPSPLQLFVSQLDVFQIECFFLSFLSV